MNMQTTSASPQHHCPSSEHRECAAPPHRPLWPEKSSVTHPDAQVHSQNPKLGHTEGPFPLLFAQINQFLTPSFRHSLSYLLHTYLHVDSSPQAPSQTAERKRSAGFSTSIMSMWLTEMGQIPADPKCLLPPGLGEAWFRWRCVCLASQLLTQEGMALTCQKLRDQRFMINSEISSWMCVLH